MNYRGIFQCMCVFHGPATNLPSGFLYLQWLTSEHREELICACGYCHTPLHMIAAWLVHGDSGGSGGGGAIMGLLGSARTVDWPVACALAWVCAAALPPALRGLERCGAHARGAEGMSETWPSLLALPHVPPYSRVTMSASLNDSAFTVPWREVLGC